LSFRITALLQAVSSGDEDAVNAIIGRGGDVNACNDGGQTPLILAVIAGHSQILPSLLRAGANPLVCDNTGLNAIDWAERKGRTDLARSLSQQFNLSTAPFETAATKPRLTPDSAEPLHSESVSPDEKSRKFVAGLKQRLEEKAALRRKTASVPLEPVQSQDAFENPKPTAEQKHISDFTSEIQSPRQSAAPEKLEPVQSQDAIEKPKTTAEQKHISDFTSEISTPSRSAVPDVLEPSLSIASPSKPSARKRCPECNRIYNSELLAYCAHHVVPLVDINAPVVTAKPKNSTPLFWSLVLITLFAATLAGMFLTNLLFKNPAPPANSPPAALVITNSRKGIPVVGRELAGKEVVLPEAEAPTNAVKEPISVTVRIKIDKGGRVYSASTTRGEKSLRKSAMTAAKQAIFSTEKLGGRGGEGTITYTFKL
jgi:FOG: Ankyrin repeat